MKYTTKIVVVFNAILSCFTVGGISVPMTRSNGTAIKDLDGKSLYDMGINLKMPLLMLLGKTIKNVEEKVNSQMCHPYPCTEWSEWSVCNARPEEFGARYRSRKCGKNKLTCELESDHRTEKESKICVFLCPSGYNKTTNGFCLKLYADMERTREEAELQCQKDGGNLIHIDSDMKYEDVNGMVAGFSSGIWIDGRRKNYRSAWEYKYGSKTGFFKWAPGQPDNHTNELCLVVAHASTGVVWHDYTCTYAYYALCEIPEM